VLAISKTSTCQDIDQRFLGSWWLSLSDGIPDQIIFKSDKTYSIYNAGNPDITNSIITNKAKKDNELIIEGNYTQKIETGIWEYNSIRKILILKNRLLIEKNSDFSDTHGYAKELNFIVRNLLGHQFEICTKKNGKDACDKFKKDSNYKEIVDSYEGKGSQSKVLSLSGYETDIMIGYIFSEPSQLVALNQEGKQIATTGKGINKTEKLLKFNLSGVTKLTIKVICEKPESKWQAKIRIL
jgi:hypothetical protein